MIRWRLIPLFGLGLLLGGTILYMVVSRARPSAATSTWATVQLEATQPTTWQNLLVSGGILQHRLSALSEHDPQTLEWQIKGDHLVFQTPPGVSAEWIASEAGRVGLVEIVDGGTQYLGVGSRVKTGERARPQLGVYQAVLTSRHFVSAEATLDENGQPIIQYLLTPEGDSLLHAHTVQQRGYYLCLAVDGYVVDCPVLRTPLADRKGVMEMQGEITLGDARVLAALLSSGPLPIPFKRVGS